MNYDVIYMFATNNKLDYNELCELVRKAAVPTEAEPAQPCGHPESLLLKSAETGEPLYCEACDDKSGRRDAEQRETELLAANQALREKIAALSKPAQQDAVDAEAVALSPEDADLLEQIVNDFCEDGETAVDQQELMRFANMGYLECERFMILPEAQDAIDTERAAISAKKGT